MKRRNRMLAVLLAFMMVVTYMPAMAFAGTAEDEQNADGQPVAEEVQEEEKDADSEEPEEALTEEGAESEEESEEVNEDASFEVKALGDDGEDEEEANNPKVKSAELTFSEDREALWGYVGEKWPENYPKSGDTITVTYDTGSVREYVCVNDNQDFCLTDDEGETVWLYFDGIGEDSAPRFVEKDDNTWTAYYHDEYENTVEVETNVTGIAADIEFEYIPAEKIVLYQGDDSDEEEDENGEEYDYYYWSKYVPSEGDEIIITENDEDTTYICQEFEDEDGDPYYRFVTDSGDVLEDPYLPTFYDDQEQENNHWTVSDGGTIYASYRGQKCTIDVAIEESADGIRIVADDDSYLWSDGTKTYSIKSNVEGDINLKVGIRDDDSWTTLLDPTEVFYSYENGTLTLYGDKIFASLGEGEVDIYAYIEGESDEPAYEASESVQVRKARIEYYKEEDCEKLPGWEDDIWITNDVYVENAQYPYGETLAYRVDEVTVTKGEDLLKYFGLGDSSYEYRIIDWEDWQKGEFEDNEIVFNISYIDLNEETQSYNYTVTVVPEMWDVCAENLSDTDEGLPGHEFDVTAKTLHKYYDEDGVYHDEEEDVTYKWYYAVGSELSEETRQSGNPADSEWNEVPSNGLTTHKFADFSIDGVKGHLKFKALTDGQEHDEFYIRVAAVETDDEGNTVELDFNRLDFYCHDSYTAIYPYVIEDIQKGEKIENLEIEVREYSTSNEQTDSNDGYTVVDADDLTFTWTDLDSDCVKITDKSSVEEVDGALYYAEVENDEPCEGNKFDIERLSNYSTEFKINAEWTESGETCEAKREYSFSYKDYDIGFDEYGIDVYTDIYDYNEAHKEDDDFEEVLPSVVLDIGDTLGSDWADKFDLVIKAGHYDEEDEAWIEDDMLSKSVDYKVETDESTGNVCVTITEAYIDSVKGKIEDRDEIRVEADLYFKDADKDEDSVLTGDDTYFRIMDPIAEYSKMYDEEVLPEESRPIDRKNHIYIRNTAYPDGAEFEYEVTGIEVTDGWEYLKEDDYTFKDDKYYLNMNSDGDYWEPHIKDPSGVYTAQDETGDDTPAASFKVSYTDYDGSETSYDFTLTIVKKKCYVDIYVEGGCLTGLPGAEFKLEASAGMEYVNEDNYIDSTYDGFTFAYEITSGSEYASLKTSEGSPDATLKFSDSVDPDGEYGIDVKVTAYRNDDGEGAKAVAEYTEYFQLTTEFEEMFVSYGSGEEDWETNHGYVLMPGVPLDVKFQLRQYQVGLDEEVYDVKSDAFGTYYVVDKVRYKWDFDDSDIEIYVIGEDEAGNRTETKLESGEWMDEPCDSYVFKRLTGNDCCVTLDTDYGDASAFSYEMNFEYVNTDLSDYDITLAADTVANEGWRVVIKEGSSVAVDSIGVNCGDDYLPEDAYTYTITEVTGTNDDGTLIYGDKVTSITHGSTSSNEYEISVSLNDGWEDYYSGTVEPYVFSVYGDKCVEAYHTTFVYADGDNAGKQIGYAEDPDYSTENYKAWFFEAEAGTAVTPKLYIDDDTVLDSSYYSARYSEVEFDETENKWQQIDEDEWSTAFPTTPGVYLCEIDGKDTYYGTVSWIDLIRITGEEPQCEHSWGDVTYTWADDHSTVTATRECSECKEKETETVNATSEVTKEPTCTEKGERTYTSDAFTNEAFKVQTTVEDIDALSHDLTAHKAADPTCAKDGNSAYWYCERCGKYFSDEEAKKEIEKDSWVIPATGEHDWSNVTYTWADDHSTVTATRECSVCKEKETETVSATSAVTKQPTCTTKGETTYTSSAFKNTAFTVQTETLEDVDALDHDWSDPVYVWSDDNSSVTATRTCANADHPETETVATTFVTVAPTCTENGSITYTATFSKEAFTEQTKVVKLDAPGHNLQKVDAVAADCETDGHYEYWQCSTCNKVFSDSEGTTETTLDTLTIPALSHDWSDVTYDPTEEGYDPEVDGETVKASRTCQRESCGQTESEEATITKTTEAASCTAPGKVTYTATFKNTAFGTWQTTREVASVGHSWGDVTYTWADDHSTVTATRECSVCGEKETETVSATSAVTKEPTCTGKGETTYTSSSFENTAFTVQTETLEDVDALGHDWGEPTYEWAEDYTSVTATRVCSRDAGHVETETVSAISAVSKEPTCTEKGEHTYTSAAFENEAFAVQTETVADIDAHGHDYGEWTELDGKYHQRVCSYDDSHVEKAEHSWGEVTYTVDDVRGKVTASRVCSVCGYKDSEDAKLTLDKDASVMATCETAGKYVYKSAAFENEAFTAQTVEDEIPALGHKWSEPVYQWSADYSQVTATRTCLNNPTHDPETETVDATSEVTKKATETEEGVTTWTSDAFKNEAFEVQTTTTVIPVVVSVEEGKDKAETTLITADKEIAEANASSNDVLKDATELTKDSDPEDVEAAKAKLTQAYEDAEAAMLAAKEAYEAALAYYNAAKADLEAYGGVSGASMKSMLRSLGIVKAQADSKEDAEETFADAETKLAAAKLNNAAANNTLAKTEKAAAKIASIQAAQAISEAETIIADPDASEEDKTAAADNAKTLADEAAEIARSAEQSAADTESKVALASKDENVDESKMTALSTETSGISAAATTVRIEAEQLQLTAEELKAVEDAKAAAENAKNLADQAQLDAQDAASALSEYEEAVETARTLAEKAASTKNDSDISKAQAAVNDATAKKTAADKAVAKASESLEAAKEAAEDAAEKIAAAENTGEDLSDARSNVSYANDLNSKTESEMSATETAKDGADTDYNTAKTNTSNAATASANAKAAAAEAARQGTYNASIPGVKAKKPKAAKKAITVKWTKFNKKKLKKSGATNYEIWVCTDGAFARGRTIERVVGKKKSSLKIKGLTKGVTYYTKVRAIKYVGGKKVVGPWSAVKAVKVKK